MSDGSRLGELWNGSLNLAEERFRQLIASPSTDWKRAASANQVLVHKHRRQDIYRLVYESDIGLEGWVEALSTPELESEWDSTVEEASIIQQVDSDTRVVKTKYVLGWPVSPRDSVTISRAHHSSNTVVHISTSLPRSPDEPAFLRPSPPYVRSSVSLRAWCIQLLSSGNTRITCFSQHDLRIALNLGLGLGGSFSPLTHLPTTLLNLINTVRKRRTRIARLVSWGGGITIERCKFENDREALSVSYSVSGLDAASIELSLPEQQGWDVRLVVKASDKQLESLPWVSEATTGRLAIRHPPLPDDHSVLKVVLSVEISGPKKGLRLNGVPQQILSARPQPRQEQRPEKDILQDVASVSIAPSDHDRQSSISASLGRTNSISIATGRAGTSDKSIQARVKRNYIYFSSLLQEPEAKWKPTTESRGVTITQLDSIDPTLMVYRAEATFVGVSMWDMYAAVSNYSLGGADREESVLLRDMNEVSLSELWWVKFKGSSSVWGNGPRDAILLKTTYKSPKAIHVFSFSADDLSPPTLPSTPTTSTMDYTRTQIPLLGWSIESLSPNTTHLVLLEQSSVRGGSGVSMMGTLVAGIGESVIRGGAPPVISRLVRGRLGAISPGQYKWKCEYAPTSSTSTTSTTPNNNTNGNGSATEIEIRCDTDTWSPSPHSLDIVVDPPPSAVSVLRRHRLSPQGGGVWLNVMHCDLVPSGGGEAEERVMITVRRGPPTTKDDDKDKGGVVIVNGERVPVDYEEMEESEIRSAQRRKRVNPETLRVPLDQPPPPTRRPQPESQPSLPEPPVGRWWSGLGLTQFQQTLASSGINLGLGERETAPSPTKSPMHHLLDAFMFTRQFHANPLLASWVPVNSSIAGLDIKKRVINEISEVHPVVKGEKVIEGVQAEDLIPLVIDDSVGGLGESRALETYLGGATSAYVTGRLGFPWRERGFWVVSGVFHQHSPASSSDNGSTSGAIYVISTAFNPSYSSTTSSFTNAYPIQEGRLHLSAYILQTLDPYNTKENYTVPSTRVTRLLCVDWNTSVPVPSQTPSHLIRSFGELEKGVKGKGGMWGVRIRIPHIGLVVDEEEEEGAVPAPSTYWYRRSQGQGDRLFIDGRWVGDSWKGAISLSLQQEKGDSADTDEKNEVADDDKVVTPDVTPTATPIPRAKSPSSVASKRERERTSSSNATLSPRGRSGSRLIGPQKDKETVWTVAEIVVDTNFKAFRDGYHISLRTQAKMRKPIALDALFATTTQDDEGLPFQYTISKIPTDGLFGVSGPATSSPTSTPREEGDGRHLISIALPLPPSMPPQEPIEDPLTGEIRNRPAVHDGWVSLLKDGEVTLGLEVCPCKGEKGKVVIKGGKGDVVVDIGEGRNTLGQGRLDRDGVIVRTRENRALDSILDKALGIIANDSINGERQVNDANPSSGERSPGEIPQNASTGTDNDGKAKSPDIPAPESSNPVPTVTSQPGGNTTLERNGGLLGLLRAGGLVPNTSTESGSQTHRRPNISPQLGNVNVSGTGTLMIVVLVALIAFLLGSLLRSLLEPTDFVYISSDGGKEGWKEVKRIVQLRILGGRWDLWVGFVRR